MVSSGSPWGALALNPCASKPPACPAQGPELFSNERVRGGSPWGAGTFAGGDGSRQPSELELDFAKYQARAAAPAPKMAGSVSAVRARGLSLIGRYTQPSTLNDLLCPG